MSYALFVASKCAHWFCSIVSMAVVKCSWRDVALFSCVLSAFIMPWFMVLKFEVSLRPPTSRVDTNVVR